MAHPGGGGRTARAGRVGLAAVLLGLAALVARAGPPDPRTEAGRRLYREGRLPSGEPLTATVAGDVPVSGSQLACQSCHGRSGLGAGEGAIRVPPVSSLLFEPSAQRRRPAYDDGALARALREGRDPSGRLLDPLMPRFRLSTPDVGALAAYLRGLSASPSPGVTDEAIRFATVVTDDVPEETRRGVLDVIARYVEEKNRETRLEGRRPGHGAPPGQRRPTTYRRWLHDTWLLSGPPETWEAQIEARYRERPVFAMLGGLSGQPWRPVARFCEREDVPCLFPAIDLPADDAGAFYSLYFSRGLLLEADLVAADLAAAPLAPVVQVFRRGGAGEQAAARLAAILERRGVAVESRPLNGPEAPAHDERRATMVLWLTADELGRTTTARGSGRVYLSSTLLERDYGSVPDRFGRDVRAAHPFVLPGDPDPALERFRRWLHARGLERPGHERRQAEAYFACLAANDALLHGGRFFVRDYALDSLDHSQGLPAYLPLHARPSTGPGQRFLSKGGFVVPVRSGRLQASQALWIAP